jgi:hypothetical protein
VPSEDSDPVIAENVEHPCFGGRENCITVPLAAMRSQAGQVVTLFQWVSLKLLQLDNRRRWMALSTSGGWS